MGAPDLDAFSLVRRAPLENGEVLAALQAFDADVVHFHHVLGFGADAPLAVRQALPHAVIALTLHEYVAICHRQGQMLRTNGDLCRRADPDACATCFPERSASAFLLRERSLQALFEVIDAFIAPSAFLADRYAEWGLPADRIAVIENLLPDVTGTTPATRGASGRLAFFGQINPFKGLDVVLEAVATLSDQDWRGRHLDVHGSGLEHQPGDYQARIAELLDRCGSRVSLHGRYDNADVGRLMSTADWIVVPSVWWENSPVVIQEAFRAGKPVIGSNLGGIAEKVQNGVNGLLFRVGDATDLAAVLRRSGADDLRASMRIPSPATPKDMVNAHVALYGLYRAARQNAMPSEVRAKGPLAI